MTEARFEFDIFRNTMTDQIKEKLSAALDGELSPDTLKVLDQVAVSEELKQAWDSYHLIGDAIRGEGVRLSAEGISARVRAQMQSEPPIIAGPRIEPKRGRPEKWLRPVAGAAIAASVATVAVLTLGEFTGGGVASGPVQVALAPIPVSGNTQTGTRWKNLTQSKVESKLNRLLVNHNEYAGSAGMGVLPYTTFVGYDGGSGGRP